MKGSLLWVQETVLHLHCPMTIAVVADLHERPYYPILDSLRHFHPDLICIPGDLFQGSHPPGRIPVALRSEYALPFLDACNQIAPCFFSLGNHEWLLGDEDFRLISHTGTHILNNSWESFNGLQLGGLTSAYVKEFQRILHEGSGQYPHREYGRRRKLCPEFNWIRDFENQPGYKLLLCHHPEYWADYLKDSSIDLVISGHAHGGQIRFFGHGLFAPGQGFFPRYTAGIHENLVISCGLSNTARPIPRLFNPPELLYLVP